MTETHSFETAPSLSKDFARLRFGVTEDNLARDIKEPGLALVAHVKDILGDVDWDHFNPRGNSAKRVFPILVAAADVTQDGREVLRQYLGLDEALIESYASRKAYPDDPERLKAIALTLRPYAEAMIEALDRSLHNIGRYRLSPQ